MEFSKINSSSSQIHNKYFSESEWDAFQDWAACLRFAKDEERMPLLKFVSKETVADESVKNRSLVPVSLKSREDYSVLDALSHYTLFMRYLPGHLGILSIVKRDVESSFADMADTFASKVLQPRNTFLNTNTNRAILVDLMDKVSRLSQCMDRGIEESCIDRAKELIRVRMHKISRISSNSKEELFILRVSIKVFKSELMRLDGVSTCVKFQSDLFTKGIRVLNSLIASENYQDFLSLDDDAEEQENIAPVVVVAKPTFIRPQPRRMLEEKKR